MANVLVIHLMGSRAAQKRAQELGQWLADRGHGATLAACAPGQSEPRDLPTNAELAVVLGGDGAMLGAVRGMAACGLSQVPILGVNLGGLGFLTEFAPDELLPAMERVLAGEFSASPRLMLEASVERDGEPEVRLTALNDVVITKEATASLVELKTAVDGRPLNTFRADGLIIATPTGSTAYNLSAGGPICHPSLDCMLVTPLASFALSNRPLLLSPSMTLSVTLGPAAPEVWLNCDGQVGQRLQPGDRVTVRGADQAVSIIHAPHKDYFEILRTKLGWG